jgi:hypothetical protein
MLQLHKFGGRPDLGTPSKVWSRGDEAPVSTQGLPNLPPSSPDHRSQPRRSFLTLDECIEAADALAQRLRQLGAQKHPLDVRRGLRPIPIFLTGGWQKTDAPFG